ncbi:MAG: DUF2961 domain-containing protein, partial [Armatimonadetes bacterium]|nr:DUF2961 domain-containing protein [Armatimonadota bacterium]
MTTMFRLSLSIWALTALMAADAQVGMPDTDPLYRLADGPAKMVNALWIENPDELRFGDGRTKVVVADLKGPGMITMIHFALPAAMKLDRGTILRIWWDGEKSPSVEAPLVDFFCDPNGALEMVGNAFVNKKRGWNCWFPMPFAKSARIELDAENPRYPKGSWHTRPCYSYVMYRPLRKLPARTAYFHAHWRQGVVQMLDGEEYEAMHAVGKGHFVGWNVTMRWANGEAGYVVDQNVKFRVDGEAEPSIEWQGIEDAFGFSWGYPAEPTTFPFTGYQPWYNGAMAYRFLQNDRITFDKSLKLTLGFGKNEIETWRKGPRLPPLQFSTVCYWYQTEPHRAYKPVPPPKDRRPIALRIATGRQPEPGETLALKCGAPDGDVEVLADGWDFVLKSGYGHNGDPWKSEIKHCWADFKELAFDIVCPLGKSGTLRLYLLDGDDFLGGRKQ